jgi:hypothetical protein
VVVPGAAIPDPASQFGLQLETPEKGTGIQSVTAAKPASQFEEPLPIEVMSDDVADRLNPTTPPNLITSNSGASNGALVWRSRAQAPSPEGPMSEIDSLHRELQVLHAELESLRKE